jgi:hypothetical protein
MPDQPKTPTRSIRIPDDEWQAALEATKAKGETVTNVVREALRRFVASAILATMVVVALGSGSPPAAAVSPIAQTSDAAFVANVRQIGAGTTIATRSATDLIRSGKSLCADINAGATRQSLWRQVGAYYTPSMFYGVLWESVHAYCPTRTDVL